MRRLSGMFSSAPRLNLCNAPCAGLLACGARRLCFQELNAYVSKSATVHRPVGRIKVLVQSCPHSRRERDGQHKPHPWILTAQSLHPIRGESGTSVWLRERLHRLKRERGVRFTEVVGERVFGGRAIVQEEVPTLHARAHEACRIAPVVRPEVRIQVIASERRHTIEKKPDNHERHRTIPSAAEASGKCEDTHSEENCVERSEKREPPRIEHWPDQREGEQSYDWQHERQAHEIGHPPVDCKRTGAPPKHREKWEEQGKLFDRRQRAKPEVVAESKQAAAEGIQPHEIPQGGDADGGPVPCPTVPVHGLNPERRQPGEK